MNGQPISGTSAGANGVRGGRGSTGLLALVLGALLLTVTACGGGDDAGGGKGGAGKAEDTSASQAVVTVAPKDGADSVATSGALKVSADQGKLTTVKVSDPKGTEVAGKIAADGASWAPDQHLAAATKYKVHAIAKDSKGRESAKDTSFTTLVPQNTFIGQYTPEDGATVGVGMPVSIHFTRGITDPDAVENAIKVTAEPSVPVEGHWFGNDRLDFRPEEYWAAGTKVTVKLNLDGVEGRPGVYGKQAKTISFTIGRKQVSTVDASTHRMKVVRDGQQIKDIPISAGAPATTTYNGQMVISEKLKVTRMNGDTVGFGGEYDIKDVPHAMRLSTSGTFIHGNYWGASGIFGSTNTSHGCVGLQDVRGAWSKKTPAAWLFDNSLIGDVVVVKNSHDKTIQPDNGLNGWNMSWSEWTK
ncbi:Ig-like domain-containing protein [Streptomyces sp. NBC_01768]|uniref:L,D-transpeptidase n=1 Tax=unclassified Streptomyces TaxID=2593676 RepID=UPI002DD9FD39|nr:Ig-like domain-containing protein [Streptomyces sp. NBC_01768]WSC27567.1 Ig-like domain-containing protein [Streptomyces sp. NBC_01768]